MVEFQNLSRRRGMVTQLSPQVYELLQANAVQDKMSGILAPPHIIMWRHQFKKNVLDINWRFIFAISSNEGENAVAGFLFFRILGQDITLEELQLSPAYHGEYLINGFVTEIEKEVDTAQAVLFAGSRIRLDANAEAINMVGLGNYPSVTRLGNLGEAALELKSRYIRV